MKEWSNYFGRNYILNDQLAQSHQSMRQRLSSIKNLSKPQNHICKIRLIVMSRLEYIYGTKLLPRMIFDIFYIFIFNNFFCIKS